MVFKNNAVTSIAVVIITSTFLTLSTTQAKPIERSTTRSSLQHSDSFANPSNSRHQIRSPPACPTPNTTSTIQCRTTRRSKTVLLAVDALKHFRDNARARCTNRFEGRCDLLWLETPRFVGPKVVLGEGAEGSVDRDGILRVPASSSVRNITSVPSGGAAASLEHWLDLEGATLSTDFFSANSGESSPSSRARDPDAAATSQHDSDSDSIPLSVSTSSESTAQYLENCETAMDLENPSSTRVEGASSPMNSNQEPQHSDPSRNPSSHLEPSSVIVETPDSDLDFELDDEAADPSSEVHRRSPVASGSASRSLEARATRRSLEDGVLLCGAARSVSCARVAEAMQRVMKDCPKDFAPLVNVPRVGGRALLSGREDMLVWF